MNLLHIDEQLGWRGGEQQASYLMRGLAARGHTIVIAGRGNGEFLHRDHGFEPAARIAVPCHGEIDLYTAWRLARVIRAHNIHIVHAHSSHAHTYACAARALARHGHAVVSRRVDFVPRNNTFSRWKYQWPDHVVAISDRIADVMRAFGVPGDKLTTVHSCIDPGRFDVAPLSRTDLGVPEDVPLLGNVAALVGHKDHTTLLEAMPRVLDAVPNLHLVIAGEGKLRPQLEEQIARLGIQDSVHLLGYRKDVPNLLHALDVFVMSSKEEGLGTSVLDAMACELPVAATAGGGIPEMVRHEQTGLLVPTQEPPALADAIIRLFREPDFAARLAAAGKALVHERFTVDTMVEGNLRVYERLLAGTEGPGQR
ncbi:MAG: glycosyltransferase [bacterium]|nr:glycosyltransferase [bacterium]